MLTNKIPKINHEEHFHNNLNTQSFSLEELEKIAKKDLQRRTNKGLLSFLSIEHQKALGTLLKNEITEEDGKKNKEKDRTMRSKQTKGSENSNGNSRMINCLKERKSKESRKGFQESLIKRDQCLHPFKYKVAQQILGLPPQDIY